MSPWHTSLSCVATLAAALLPAAPAAAAGGDLQIFPDPGRLLVLMILFALLIPLLNRLLFRPVLRVLDERAERTEGSRKRAAELGKEAAELLGRYQAALQQARGQADAERKGDVAQARREHAEAVAQARSAAEAQLEATRGEVAAALAAARATLRAEAGPLAREVAERLLGRRLA